jgi:hypothetical protein
MKPLIILLLLCATVALGQNKPEKKYRTLFQDTSKKVKQWPFAPIQDQSADSNEIMIPLNKLDTVACWFKEVIISITTGTSRIKIVNGKWYSDFMADTTIRERWQHGYKVGLPYPIITFNGERIEDTYLYSDRKTKVTNRVIYSFER